MPGLQQAPIFDQVVGGFGDDSRAGFDGKAKQSWILFFQTLIAGDSGTRWLPVSTNLTHTGSDPTITGIYFQNQGFIDFYIYIIGNPATTSTSGSTYFDLPFDVQQDTHCTIVTGLNGAGLGVVNAATNRAYVPGWTAVTTPITVTGRVKI